LNTQQMSRHAIASCGYRCMGLYGSKPTRRQMLCHATAESHHKVALDILQAFRPTVPFDMGTARIDGPGRVRELARHQHLVVARLPGPDRDICLAFRQIEIPVGHDKLDLQAWIARMKTIDESCPYQTIAQGRGAGHANCTGEPLVARPHLAIEGSHRLLDPFRIAPQPLAELGEAITIRMTLDKPAAEPLFELREPACHGRLVDAECFRCRQRATAAGEGEEVLEVVPGEHALDYATLRMAFAILRLPRL